MAVHRTDAGLPVFTGDPAHLAPEERAWLEGAAARRVEVPSGFSRFPGDILRPPRAWLERVANSCG